MAQIANLKNNELMEYEASLKAHRDYQNVLVYAKKEAETKKEIEVIKNLILKTGFNDVEIADFVGVSVEQVANIRKELS